MPAPRLPASWQCLLLCLACQLYTSAALSWRLFAGRHDCMSAYMPDNQWEHIAWDGHDDHATNVVVEAGFAVSNKDGTDHNRGTVDVTVYDQHNQQVHVVRDVAEGEVKVHAHGGRGPWKICFLMNQRPSMQWSLLVDLTFFTVNQEDLKGTSFEWQRFSHKELKDHNLTAHGLDPKNFVQIDQIEGIAERLTVIESTLGTLRHEVDYLTYLFSMHTRTAKQGHANAFWHYLLVSGAIVGASVCQVVGVRMLFSSKKENRHLRGII